MKHLIILSTLFILLFPIRVNSQNPQYEEVNAYLNFFMADSISGRVDSTLAMEINIGYFGPIGRGKVGVFVDTSGNAGHPNNTPNIDLLVIRKVKGRSAVSDSHFSSIGAGAWEKRAVVYRPNFTSKGIAKVGEGGIEDTLLHIDSLTSAFYIAPVDTAFLIPFGTEILRFELNEDSTTAAGDTSRGIYIFIEAIFQ